MDERVQSADQTESEMTGFLGRQVAANQNTAATKSKEELKDEIGAGTKRAQTAAASRKTKPVTSTAEDFYE